MKRQTHKPCLTSKFYSPERERERETDRERQTEREREESKT